MSLKSFLFGRGALAVGIVLFHLALAYLFIHSRVPAPVFPDLGPVMADLMADPQPARAASNEPEVDASPAIKIRPSILAPTRELQALQSRPYRYVYSRIGERSADGAPGEQAEAGTSEATATPGGEAALRQFIDDLNSGNVPRAAQGGSTRSEIAKLRSALDEWGAVRSVQFSGGVGDRSWTAYDIKSEFRDPAGPATVEVRWDTYEVHHEHGISVWRVAVDRDGTVWSAEAGTAPSAR